MLSVNFDDSNESQNFDLLIPQPLIENSPTISEYSAKNCESYNAFDAGKRALNNYESRAS